MNPLAIPLAIVYAHLQAHYVIGPRKNDMMNPADVLVGPVPNADNLLGKTRADIMLGLQRKYPGK